MILSHKRLPFINVPHAYETVGPRVFFIVWIVVKRCALTMWLHAPTVCTIYVYVVSPRAGAAEPGQCETNDEKHNARRMSKAIVSVDTVRVAV